MRDHLGIPQPGLGNGDVGDERRGRGEEWLPNLLLGHWVPSFTESGNKLFSKLAVGGHSELLQGRFQ